VVKYLKGVDERVDGSVICGVIVLEWLVTGKAYTK
jgi:hypothetical protein